MDYDGNLVGKRLLSFANGTIDESAKLNFVGAEQQGKLTNGMHLLNNPFELPNGICVMEVTDYSNKRSICSNIKILAKSCTEQKNLQTTCQYMM